MGRHKSLKCMPKLIKKCKKIAILGAIIDDFGGRGGSGVRVWNQRAQRSSFTGRWSPFGRSFWHLFGIFADVFLSVFSGALVFRTLGGFGV